MINLFASAGLQYLFFPEVVVVHLYHEHYATTGAGDGVGHEHGPYHALLVQQSLQHEGECANSHH